MKVLLVHPSAEMYGADRMFLETLDALVDAGLECEVCLPANGPLFAAVASRKVAVTAVHVPVLRKSLMSPRGAVAYAVEVLTALPRLRTVFRRVQPDVIYVSTLTVPVWLLAARLHRTRVMCHVHEAEESVPRFVRRALTCPLLLAHVVLANSQVSRQAVVAEFRGLRAKTRVIYNGVRSPDYVSAPLDRPHSPVRLVLVGRVSPRKGTDLAIDAVAELVRTGYDVTLDIVGGTFAGYEWFEASARRRVEELRLGSRVTWCGEQPSPYPALSGADIALVPSRVEPFGNTAVEALLAQRPLVAAGTQGLVEIVAPSPSGVLVRPDDAVALAQGVAQLIDDWPRAVGDAAAGAEDARSRFSPARYGSDMAAAVTALLKDPTPTGGMDLRFD